MPFQLEQVFTGRYSAHHPLLHTLLLGGCVRLGQALGSINLGAALYTVLQMIAVPLLLLLSVFPDLPVLYYAAYGFLWASLVMTVVSGTEYIWKNKNVFSM